MEDKWITWFRHSHSRTGANVTSVRLDSEGKPKTFPFSRMATSAEIAEEKQRRAKRESESREQEEFQARPDYQDASAIRNILEWMSPVDHPLDRLTPQEWAELRKKLESGPAGRERKG